jgi:RNA polymerase sigma-32 factor
VVKTQKPKSDSAAPKPKTKAKERSTKLVARATRPKSSGAVTVARSADPLLQAYLREVQRYPLLTREEEHELALKFHQTKDREALHKLVTSNLRFVIKIAYEYVHYRAKLLDLIQEGNMGLVKAVQEFDPYKEVRLTTYAVWWIRSYIQDAILRNYSLVKMGTTQAQKKLFYRLRAEQNRLEQQGIVPQQNVKLLAGHLDVREKDVQEMDQRLSQGDLSLNATVNSEDKKEHIQSLMDPTEPFDEALGNAEQKEIFGKILGQFSQTLEGREKVIFSDRLISEDPMTLQEIGDKYGITKERARQIEEQIKEKLRNYVKQHYPDYNLLTGAL